MIRRKSDNQLLKKWKLKCQEMITVSQVQFWSQTTEIQLEMEISFDIKHIVMYQDYYETIANQYLSPRNSYEQPCTSSWGLGIWTNSDDEWIRHEKLYYNIHSATAILVKFSFYQL